MNIILNNSSMIPIYEQLIGQIKNEILDGKLKTGEILPSVRMLSSELKISALTVKKAYDKLEEDGYVITVHGKGTYVGNVNQELAAEMQRRNIEEFFITAIDKARLYGMSNEEIMEIVTILLEE